MHTMPLTWLAGGSLPRAHVVWQRPLEACKQTAAAAAAAAAGACPLTPGVWYDVTVAGLHEAPASCCQVVDVVLTCCEGWWLLLLLLLLLLCLPA
jgi:hypothetical protein